MSQSGIASIALSGGGGGGTGIQTIVGDSGSITGNTVTIFADNAINLNGATVQFTNLGSPNTLFFELTDGFNMFLGTGSGNAAAKGAGANGNVCVGGVTLHAITTGNFNTVTGFASAQQTTTGSYNSIYGAQLITTGITGSYNLIMGSPTGLAYAGAESSNILLSNGGVTGESNAIHIGTQGSGNGQQNTCSIAGITGVTVANPQQVVINTATGQLGVVNTALGSWSDISGAVNATAGQGYFVNATATSTLPSSPNQGDTVSYIVDTANVLTIQASPGQAIRIGSTVSSPGGTAKSNGTGNSVTLVYRTISNSWISSATNGIWTIV